MNHLHAKVSALVDGELSQSARARALRHARSCPVCRREIEETIAVKQRLSQLAAADVSCDLWLLVASAPAGEEPSCDDDPRLGPAIRRVAASLGSMSVFVLVLAYLVGVPETAQSRPVTPPVNELAAEFADGAGAGPLGDPAVDSSAVTTRAVSFSVGGSPPPGAVPVGVPSGGLAISGRDGDRATGLLPSPAAPGGDDPRAVALLRAALVAPQHVAFRGLRVCRSYLPRDVETVSVEIRHVPGQGTVYSVRGSGDQPRFAVFVAAGPTDDALQVGALSSLLSSYDVDVAGAQRILGRKATVVSASQDGQVQARFWIDDRTGLLLRRDLYAEGQLVRESSYRSLQTARHGFIPHLPPELPHPPTTRLSTQVAAALTDKGWEYPTRLAGGFRLEALRQVDTDGGIMGADYSDGLSTVTVFEQRGTLDPASLDGFRPMRFGDQVLYVRDGLPTTVVWQVGSVVVTAFTDVPEQDTASVVASFPRVATAPPPDDGVTGRVEQGLSRLVSAVAP